MLQRAASNACSWWWASHIRTKQSKWLEQSLQDMEEKVNGMLKLIEEDGDSFAKRAEMYYKRRPELINSVEETYRAFKALADRYDILSKELQNANHTIATVFPEQVQFDMDEDEDCPTPKPKIPQIPSSNRANVPKVPNAPIENLKGIITTASKQFKAKKSTAKEKSRSKPAVVKSGLSKDEGLVEIDKLHKDILSLQTVKEFVKSSYESGLAKYWEIENQIIEMQDKVCRLQDEFDVETVIEDNEARTLMAEAALKSCQETLAVLQEKQEKSTREAQEEFKKIESARQLLKSIRRDYMKEQGNEEDDSSLVKDVSGLVQESKGKTEPFTKSLDLSFKASLTVTELAEKIDELVNKVISLETAVSAQTVLINTLRTESGDLHAQIKNLEDEKESLIGNTQNLSSRVREMEDKLSRVQDLNKNVETQNNSLQTNFAEARSSLDHLSEKLSSVKPDEDVEETGSPQDKVGVSLSEHKVEETGSQQDKAGASLSERKVEQTGSGRDKAGASLSERKVEQTGSGQDKAGVSLSERKVEQTGSGQDKAGVSLSERKVEQTGSGQDKAGVSLSEHKVEQTGSAQDKAGVSLSEHKVEQTASAQEKAGVSLSEHKVEQTGSAQDKAGVSSSEHKVEETGPAQDKASVSLSEHKVEKEIREDKKDVEIKDKTDGKSGKSSTVSSEKEDIIKDVKEVGVDVAPKEEEVKKHVKKTVTFVDNKPKEDVPADHHCDEPVKGEARGGEKEKEEDLSWQQMLLSGTEDREKILLKEYTAILRNYKDVKKKLSDTEKKEKDSQFDTTVQMRDLKQAIVKRDQEIQRLHQKLNLLQGNINNNNNKDVKEDTTLLPDSASGDDPSVKTQSGSGDLEDLDIEIKEDDIKIVFTDGDPALSIIEEKLRMEIDAILDENLDFWLRFSTAFHQVQKFKSEVQDLQDEISKLSEKKKQEGSITNQHKSEARPIYKHLREIQTELTVWLEQSVSLKDELKRRFSSLCSIQEEIMKALREGVEEEEIRFSSHQAAKLQGEILNMKQENNKVREELQAGLDHVGTLQLEIEKTLRQLNEEFGVSSDQPQLQHSMSRSRVPLRSFIFGTKQRKPKNSLFSFMHPNRKFHVVRAGVPLPNH